MVQLVRLVIGLRSIDLEHDLEGDTIETINAYLRDNKDQYREFHGLGHDIVGENANLPETIDVTDEAVGTTAAAVAPVKKERKKRGAVEAVAPAPIPVPSEAPPAPVAPAPVAVPVDTGIPAFLDRTGAAPVALAPPPPPAPVAPPPAPAAPVSPPVGVLAGKVVAELKRRGDGAADQGAGLVAWLAGAGLCVPGCSFQEACDCVAFLSDEKVKPVADALQIAS